MAEAETASPTVMVATATVSLTTFIEISLRRNRPRSTQAPAKEKVPQKMLRRGSAAPILAPAPVLRSISRETVAAFIG
jgi:hypothetical protein